MKKSYGFILWMAVAAALPVLGGCGTLAATPVLMVSVASSVLGGMANGAVMGGSSLGVIHNAMAGDEDLFQPEKQDDPAPPIAVAQASVFPKIASGLERACSFPNASGRGLPCS
jgi:hypothetical protein